MTQDEIIRELLDHLEQHLNGHQRSMDQHTYKWAFFKLFKETFNQGYFDSGKPLLTADSLSDILADRWLKDDSQDKQKKDLIADLHAKWTEWRYAWDHYSDN